MKFINIDHIVVFGGSQLVLEFLKILKKKKINFHYFTNRRQLNDKLINNLSLKKNLIKNKIKFYQTENINKNKFLKKIFTKNSLGIGIGQPWKFKKEILKLMNPNLIDFMGIPLPTYRGGAHYSWMILNKDRKGGCFLQNVNQNTLQGYIDTNKYYLKKEYTYPKNLINPKDYFIFSSKVETDFLISFLNKIKKPHSFKLKNLSQMNSIMFPRLVSKLNSYINWDLEIDEIVRFINAFSDPYPGAQTFLRSKKIYLKNAKIYEKNNFHSFTAGIITNIYKKKLHICAKGGIITANFIYKMNIKNASNIEVGERLLTNDKFLKISKYHKKF